MSALLFGLYHSRFSFSSGEAEAAVEKTTLSDDMLDRVAGGVADHNECKDTYEDHENCWLTDQCNFIFAHYGEPQNSIDIEFDLMCKDNFETYEEKFHSEAW